jgi:tRNA-binding EMAP/Myf-like protein
LVKDEKGDLLADSHNILNRQKNCFCQLLNIHGANNVRQTEILSAEPYIKDLNLVLLRLKLLLKSWKLPGTDQILVEFIHAGSNTLCSEIQKFINCIWNMEAMEGIHYFTYL